METTDESIMYTIDKLRIDNDEFYILDKKQKVILVFDKSGKYLRKLNKIGRGPDEYLSLNDFFIFNSHVYVLSHEMQKILKYDMSFNLKNTFNTHTYASNIEYFDSKIFLYTNYSSISGHNLYIYDMETGEILNKYMNYNLKQLGTQYRRTTFAKDEENIYLFLPYDYNIYILNEKNETIFLSLNFGESKMFSEEFKNFSTEEKNYYIKSRYTGFDALPINGINNLHISKDLIYFTFVYLTLQYSLFFDKKIEKFQLGCLIRTEKFPLASAEPLLVINNSLISFEAPDDFSKIAESYERKNISVPQILKAIKPEGNPVLCIHHFK